MKSLRSWFLGLALGLSLAGAVPSIRAQGIPNGITYQGIVEENGAPVNGPVQMTFTVSDALGNVLWSETLSSVVVENGLFNVVLRSFPTGARFDQQYSLSVVVTDGATMVTLPPTLLWSAPYAFNTMRAGGIDISATPVNGDIFPMPLDANGKINASMLPPIPLGNLQASVVQTVNGIGPNSNGNFQINAGSGITITPGTNSITIDGPAGSIITSVTGTNGITGGGSAGNIVLGIGYGAITSQMLNPDIAIQWLSADNGASSGAAIVAVDSETNGNSALMIDGGIGANNRNGTTDGSGLNSGSPQTYWADEVSVPAATTTSLQIYNKLVGALSTIVLTPVGSSAFAGGLTVTAQSAGTFTVSSKNTMGTSGGGVMTALNYLVINH